MIMTHLTPWGDTAMRAGSRTLYGLPPKESGSEIEDGASSLETDSEASAPLPFHAISPIPFSLNATDVHLRSTPEGPGLAKIFEPSSPRCA